MILKRAFLLIELLVALSMLVLMLTAFTYFLFIILQTRELSVKRLKALNYAINIVENNKNEKVETFNNKKDDFSIKIESISIGKDDAKKTFYLNQVEVCGKTSFKKEFYVRLVGNAKKV